MILGSVLEVSERLVRTSSISEIVSGFAGGVSAAGSTVGAGTGAAGGCFALLIGGTADLRLVLASVGAFFLLGEIKSVAGCGGGEAEAEQPSRLGGQPWASLSGKALFCCSRVWP